MVTSTSVQLIPMAARVKAMPCSGAADDDRVPLLVVLADEAGPSTKFITLTGIWRNGTRLRVVSMSFLQMFLFQKFSGITPHE